jgi:hypothetical protein
MHKALDKEVVYLTTSWKHSMLLLILSRDNYLFEGPKNETVLFEWALMVFTILDFFLWRKSKVKFLLASMKSLTNCDIPSSNPLQRYCSGFLIAACVPKGCSVNCLWSWKLLRKPAMNVHWKKSTNESKGKPEICCGFWNNFLELVSVFKEESKNFLFLFLLN